jgi:hypothetical protein
MPVSRLQFLQKVEFAPAPGIKGSRRLIGDQDIRLEAKRHGDHQALALAARKLVRIIVHPLLCVDNRHAASVPACGRGIAGGDTFMTSIFRNLPTRCKPD